MNYDPKLERACFYWPATDPSHAIPARWQPILARDEFSEVPLTLEQTSWNDVSGIEPSQPPSGGLWVFEGAPDDDEIIGQYRQLYPEERIALDEGRLTLFWSELRKKDKKATP